MALKRALPLLTFAFGLILFVVFAVASADMPVKASPVQYGQAALAVTDTPTPIVCGQVGNYLIATSTATIVPSTYDTGVHCDDCQINLSLPFPFQLYDQVSSNMIVTSNGWAGYPPDAYNNSCLPVNWNYRSIFPYWDDLRTDGTGRGIFTSTTGTAPNRIFNIEWRTDYFIGGTANFELRLYENGGADQYFDVVYGQMDRGNAGATAGVQGLSGLYTEYACNGAGGPITSGLSLRYLQPACSTATPTSTGTLPTATSTNTGTPTATPTMTATGTPPSATRTPTNTSTSQLGCYINVTVAESGCIVPDTFGYHFQLYHNCGSIPSAVTAYFDVAPGDQGPWTQYAQQPETVAYDLSIKRDFHLQSIPANYTWYKIRVVGTAPPPHPSFFGETPPRPICTGQGGTYTPTMTGTPLPVCTVPTSTPYPTATNYPTPPCCDVCPVLPTHTPYPTSTQYPCPACPTYTLTPSNTPTRTPTLTLMPTQTYSPSPTPTFSGQCILQTVTPNPTYTPRPSPTATRTHTPCPVPPTYPPRPTYTPNPTFTVTATASGTPPTGTPTIIATPTCSPAGTYRVLIVYGGYNAPTYLQTAIQAEPGVTAVDIFSATAGTPTLGQLQQYSLVVAGGDLGPGFLDPITLGNNLADYVDGGGIVVQMGMSFDYEFRYGINGRWFPSYTPYQYTYNFVIDVPFTLGTYNPSHPLMQNVSTLNARWENVVPAPGAGQVAASSNGNSLVAYRQVGGHITVGITAYLGGGVQQPSGDWGRLIVNAARWLNPPPCVPTPTVIGTATWTATATPTNPTGVTNTPTYTSTNTPTDTPVPGAVTSTPTILVTSTVCPIQFTDVPPGSTFYAYIRCLVCRGIVNGYGDGTFRPNNDVTRGQLSKIISNAAGFNDPQTTQMFEDEAVGSTYYTYTARLASRGYISGYPCGGPGEPCVPPDNLPYFRPNNNATRGQIAKIDANSAGFVEPPVGQTFEDVPPGSTFYDFVERLASRGVMSGYPCGTVPSEPCNPPENRPYFRPNNNATRGQSSKIVANTFFPDCQTPSRR